VGQPARGAATSNVEVGQTIYPLTGKGRKGGERKERSDEVTKRRGGKGTMEETQGFLAKDRGL